MSKTDSWIRRQDYNYEFDKRRNKSGTQHHDKKCQCANCKDARYFANQESQ